VCQSTQRYERTSELLRPSECPWEFPVYRCTGCDFEFLDATVYGVAESGERRRKARA
jgi:hypothetical protein